MGYEIVKERFHKDVKVGSGLALHDIGATNHCWLGLSEIAEAACDYPLVFLKAQETGRFRLVALMGFQSNVNLFVLDGQCVATYLPNQFTRAPFALAKTETGDLVAAIDMDHPRARDPSGNALFDKTGNETDFLVTTRTQLSASAIDQTATLAFIDALLAHSLIAPMLIDLDPDSGGEPVRLDGIYTISREKLAALGDSAIIEFHNSGYLAGAYAIINSLKQIARLQQLHNAHAQRDTRVLRLSNVSVGLPD